MLGRGLVTPGVGLLEIDDVVAFTDAGGKAAEVAIGGLDVGTATVIGGVGAEASLLGAAALVASGATLTTDAGRTGVVACGATLGLALADRSAPSLGPESITANPIAKPAKSTANATPRMRFRVQPSGLPRLGADAGSTSAIGSGVMRSTAVAACGSTTRIGAGAGAGAGSGAGSG